MNEPELLQDFDKLYEHFFSPIYAFVFRRIRPVETVEDIVSETFLKAYRHLDTFEYKHEGSLSAWLYTIARNEIFQHLRKTKDKETVALDDIAEPSVGADFVKEFDDRKLHDTVKALLEELPEEERELIRYKYFDELSNIEIAQILGISDNNATVRLHRAMKKFKNLLEEHNLHL